LQAAFDEAMTERVWPVDGLSGDAHNQQYHGRVGIPAGPTFNAISSMIEALDPFISSDILSLFRGGSAYYPARDWGTHRMRT
jgi:hypothetical protein